MKIRFTRIMDVHDLYMYNKSYASGLSFICTCPCAADGSWKNATVCIRKVIESKHGIRTQINKTNGARRLGTTGQNNFVSKPFCPICSYS